MAKKAKEDAIVVLLASNYPIKKQEIRVKANQEMAEKAKLGWDYTEAGNSALASLAYKAERSPANPLKDKPFNERRVFPWKLRVIEIIPLRDYEEAAPENSEAEEDHREDCPQESLFDPGKYIRDPRFSS